MTRVDRAADAEPEFTPKDFLQQVPPIGTWEEWAKLAQAATTFEQKLGLLHVGFDVEVQANPGRLTSTDRLKFYFGVADGWATAGSFRDEGLLWSEECLYYVGRDKHHNVIKRRVSEQRELLARKAFEMLAKNYFKPMLRWLEETNNRNRDGHFELDPAFLMIQEFFRVEKGGVRNLNYQYLKPSPSEELVVEFLLKLPKFLWSWEEERINSYDSAEFKEEKDRDNTAAKEIVAAAKLWIIQVLAKLKELELLEEWLDELDEPCIAKLTEIALSNQLSRHLAPVKEHRRVQSLDEACYVGSAAGWLVKKWHLRVAEHERLQGIRQAEFELEEAQRRHADLTKQK